MGYKVLPPCISVILMPCHPPSLSSPSFLYFHYFGLHEDLSMPQTLSHPTTFLTFSPNHLPSLCLTLLQCHVFHLECSQPPQTVYSTQTWDPKLWFTSYATVLTMLIAIVSILLKFHFKTVDFSITVTLFNHLCILRA